MKKSCLCSTVVRYENSDKWECLQGECRKNFIPADIVLEHVKRINELEHELALLKNQTIVKLRR